MGIGSFTLASGDEGEEPDLDSYAELKYAAECAHGLSRALATAGFEAELITDPAELSAEMVGEHFERHISGGGVAVVHVLSHGEYAHRGGVYVVGSDCQRSQRA